MNNKQNILKDNISLFSKKQITIGITGGSGSGKSTIAEIIKEKTNHLNVHIEHLDEYFLPIEKFKTYYSDYLQKKQPNFNHPKSIDFNKMIKCCQAISDYDILILEGHFALYAKEMRELMDLKIFIDVNDDEMLKRRTIRNLKNNYGGNEENIRHYNKECVLPMYQKFIRPQKKYADIIIPNSDCDLKSRDALINEIVSVLKDK